jgi:excisionase family DNA binding protein
MGVLGVMGVDAKLVGSSGRRRAWMDAEEAAEALGTTAHTMRRLARDGRSPAVVRRVGGRWRWSRADVERFVRGEPGRVA